MEGKCPQHGKSFTVACLEQGCKQPFLCLVCIRIHDEDHSEFINLLENDTEWLKPHNTELEQLRNHPLLISPPDQYDVLAHNKELINQMIENLILKIKEKGNLLIEEMTKQMEEQQAIEKFSKCLREKYEIIQNVNFRQDDIFHLAKEVIRFREELLPDIQEALKLMNEDLTTWKLNPIKASQAEKLLQRVIIENINLDDLFSGFEAEQLEAMSPSLKESLKSQKKLQKEIDEQKECLKTTEKKFLKKIRELEKKLEEDSEEDCEDIYFLSSHDRELKQLQSLYDSEKKSNSRIQSQLDAVLTISGDSCGRVYEISSSESVFFCKGYHLIRSCQIAATRPCFKTIKYPSLGLALLMDQAKKNTILLTNKTNL